MISDLTYYLYINILIIALFIGSFLNVVALRVPNGESIIFPSSHCTKCNHKLGVFDLIPFISYFILRGRCRYCGDRVSFIYPLFEALTAFGAYLVLQAYGLTAEFFVGFFFFCVLITVTITDIKYMLVPDKILLPSMAVMLILRLFIHPLSIWNYIIGFFLGGFLLLLIAILSKGGMGGGDVKLFAFIGLALGIANMLFAFLVACLVGSVVGILLIRLGIYKRKQPIAFVPYILIGSMTSYLWGASIIHMYMNLYH